MTWLTRLLIGACWGIALGLLTLAVLTAIYPEPCVDDGVVTNMEACDPGARDGLTIEGSR